MDPATWVAIGGIVVEVLKRPSQIIKRHVNYITNFKIYLEDFQNQLSLYEAKKQDIQGNVDEGHRNLQVPTNEVHEILNQCREFDRCYEKDLEYLSTVNVEMVKNCERHSIGKKALKLKEEIQKLVVQLNSLIVYTINLPPSTGIKMSTNYLDILDSVEKVRIQVMTAIKDPNKTVVGLYGMGGVGKTTLMEKINNDLLSNTSYGFTYVIMVTVSTTPNIRKLQDTIAERVGYKDLEKYFDINIKARKLKERLEKEKSILIILDDVWERLDLNEVGIPSDSGENNHCKIVLTARNKSACQQMNAKPIIKMGHLVDEEEAWKLFEEKSGAITTESMRKIAKDICKKCARLPLVISVVASTLKNEDKEFMWIDFLSKSGKSDPTTGLVDMENEVYIPLKRSYDHLFFKKSSYDHRDYNDLQLCFLFCSLFPEDHEIHLRELMYYGIGEGFVICDGGESSSLICTQALIHKLKSCGLLLEVERGEMFVKMHDVIRHMAIFIAKNDKKIDFYTNFEGLTMWPDRGDSETRKRISLMGNSIQHIVDHQKFDGKQIKSLLLNDNWRLETIADNFFVKMDDLLVLDMRGTNLKSLPSSIQNLTNLHVLMVSSINFSNYGCNYINIQHLFFMEHLSVLVLRHIGRILELTKEFGDLVHLKVLDFTNTAIDIIWPNVLSKLTKLEELLLRGSFNLWDGCNEDGKSFVSIFELDSLKRLYALEVDVANNLEILSKSAPDNFLQSFVDRDKKKHTFFNINFVFPSFNIFRKGSALSLKGKLQFPKWILLLMKETESLRMEECKSFQQQLMQNSENTEDYGVFKNLREVCISSCENCEDVVLLKSHALKSFVNLEDLDISRCKLKRVIEYDTPNSGDDIVILPKITRIELYGLDELENIFANTVTPTVMPNGSFHRLKTIVIRCCSKLKLIFPWNVAVCLVHLNFLEISSCSQLEVIVGKAESDYDQVLFPKLEIMILKVLPNLESLWKEQS